MEREKKKRMMPRHLMTSAIISGIIPLDTVPKEALSLEEIQQLRPDLAKKANKRVDPVIDTFFQR